MAAHRLSSYGTLQQPEVQDAVFGRRPQSRPAAIAGHRLDWLTVTDAGVVAASGTDRHPVLHPDPGADPIAGTVLELSDEELAAADRYEVDDYRRVVVPLADGGEAWVFVFAPRPGPAAEDDAVELRVPGAGEHPALRAMARRSFADTFAADYDAEPFERFLDTAYGPDGGMQRDLHDARVRWQVAFADREPVGFAKLTPLRAPAPDPVADALELQQIYVLGHWHGRGVAPRLARWAIDIAQRETSELYLTVFDHNERAKRFYARLGFHEVGRCTFTLGDRVDDDRIWRLELPRPSSDPSG